MSNADTEKTTRDPTMGDHTRDILQASVAGVVRRDGLREAVARVLIGHQAAWVDDREARVGYYGFYECGCNEDGHLNGLLLTQDDVARHQADEIARVLDAVPDVPPEPPAADRGERLTRDVAASLRITPEQEVAARPLVNELSRLAADTWPELWAVPLELLAIALQSSGRLVDAADVRARALEDAADEIERNARATERQETSGDKGRVEAHNYPVGLGLRRAASIAKRRAQSERERRTT